MDTNELMKNALRAEGYAQGFKDGYASCVKQVLEMEKNSGTENNQGNTTDIKA
jgi:hypothetical protein